MFKMNKTKIKMNLFHKFFGLMTMFFKINLLIFMIFSKIKMFIIIPKIIKIC